MESRKWTEENLANLIKLLEDDRPLYIFMDEHEKVVDSEWFSSVEEAMNHACTLSSDTIYLCAVVGCAENKKGTSIIY